MKNVFHSFTRQSLKKNRSRTIVTIIGILLSMALLTAVIQAVNSGLSYLRRSETLENGSYHGIYKDIPATNWTRSCRTMSLRKPLPHSLSAGQRSIQRINISPISWWSR